MLFGLEQDSGDHISFYLVPDTYSGRSEVNITCEGRQLYSLAANELREPILLAGRHETGVCGFRITSDQIPNLNYIRNLTIHEKSSNVLVYRRNDLPVIGKKVFRLETRLLPMYEFDNSIMTHFGYAAKQIERFGLETSTQMFVIFNAESIYLSGRLLLKNYSYQIDSGFSSIICIDDPFVGLAERLLILSKMGKSNAAHILSDRDATLMLPAVQFAAELDFEDAKSLRKSLRSVPEDVAVALVNPLTRALTASTPDEMPRGGALASALDALSMFTIVGVQPDFQEFRESVSFFLGLPIGNIKPPQTFQTVMRLAGLLRAEGKVESLLDLDIEVFNHVQQARKLVYADDAESMPGHR